MPYDPPETTNLPFNFTSSGYSAPNSKELLINFAEPGNFGTLSAAVNVMQAPDYLNQTYSYVKSCPSYVIGYGPGGIQVIHGRCIYGGIRDLRASLTAVGIATVIANLPASIHGIVLKDLSAMIGTHSPADLGAWVHIYQTSSDDLPASLSVIYSADLPAVLEGTHDPGNLMASVFTRGRGLESLLATIRGWQASDLIASIKAMQYGNLPTYLNPIEAVYLPAYLKVWPQEYLPASTYGWAALDLSAYLNQILSSDIHARIVGRDDMFGNLRARLKGYVSSQEDLNAYLMVWSASDLQGILRVKYLHDLSAYVFPVLPKSLSGFLHAWQIKDLQGILNGLDYPWNLTANITSTGYWQLLPASISPVQQSGNYENFRGLINAWQLQNLSARIFVDDAPYLSAYLNVIGHAANLHASIYPKVIRLTTILNISTLSHGDLSATINSPCFYTNVKNLLASIYPKFKGDLAAYIRPLSYDYKPVLLGAKAGYADSYLEVDKLKFNILILPSQFFTIDKFKLMINLFSSGSLLGASIVGTMLYTDLTAAITGEEISSYTFSSLIKNREKVIKKTYGGVFESFEIVEMVFSSVVSDYYYSSSGNYSWKKDRLERWMLDVRSMLPQDTALRLKRRLHRATTLYDLKKFVSIDEAMKFAIAYVTEYPQEDLSASIVNKGTFRHLSGLINPKYVQSSRGSLSSSITPVENTVVLGKSGSISKI